MQEMDRARWAAVLIVACAHGLLVAVHPLGTAALASVLLGAGGLAWALSSRAVPTDAVSLLLLAVLALHVVAASQLHAGTALSVARFGSLAILIPVVWVLHVRDRATNRSLARVIPPFGLLAMLGVASISWSIAPLRTLGQVILLVLVLALLVALGATRWSNREQFVKDLRMIFVVFGAVAMLGLLAWFVGVGWATFPPRGRVAGIYPNPNGAAMVAALMLPLGMGLLVRASTAPQRVLHLALLGALAGSLLASGSRTGLAAAVAGGMIMAGLGWRRYWRVAVVVGALLLGAVISGVIGDPGVRWERDSSSTFSGREGAWLTLIEEWRDEPFLGYGYRTTEVILEARRGRPHEYVISTAHNGYLQVLVELGVLGALVLASLVIAVARAGWRCRRDPLGVALLASVGAGFTIQVGESSLFGFGNAFALPFWLLVAALLSMPPRRGAPSRSQPSVPGQLHDHPRLVGART